jgi:hypothetical protein
MNLYRYEFLDNSYWVFDPRGNRIASCHAARNAEQIVAALCAMQGLLAGLFNTERQQTRSTMDEPKQPSEKLKRARAEIEAILKAYDIAGHVVLHEPGWGEVFAHLSPSYSCVTGSFPSVRLRSKLADYGGDADAQKRDLEATVNMLSIFAELLGQAALSFIELSTVANIKTRAEHTEGQFIPDKETKH